METSIRVPARRPVMQSSVHKLFLALNKAGFQVPGRFLRASI